MMEPVAEALLQHGPLGVALVALGYAYWMQVKEIRDLQSARVDDVRKTVGMLLDLVDKQHEAVGELTEAVKRLEMSMDSRRRS
jgi:hypothetical protein